MKAFEHFSRERSAALRTDENWRFSHFEKLLEAAKERAAAEAPENPGFDFVVRGEEPNEIHVPAGTHKSVVELILAGTGEKTRLSKIIVGENASLERTVVQIAPAGTAVLTADTIDASGTGAEIKSVFVNLGGGYVRATVDTTASAERTFLKTQILNCAAGTQFVDVRTVQRHSAGETRSELLCKNILRDRATTVFGGNIVVPAGVKGVSATQNCRNLSLGPETLAHALPGLEIDANDVHCSHGAVNSSIDNEQLFYFLQRGISEDAARELLVRAFAGEIIDDAGTPELAEFLRERIFKL